MADSFETLGAHIPSLQEEGSQKPSEEDRFRSLGPDDTIRLMELLPGAFDDEIRIMLHTTILSKEQIPEYEALSYTWGSQKDPVDVFIKPRVDDKRSKHGSQPHRPDTSPLAVTQNLATALRHLRRPERKRTLWIDAICVNQQDLKERGHQVERMADVYRNADQVLVWLGPESDNSAWAIGTLLDLSLSIDVDWRALSMEPSSQGQSHWADGGEQLPYDDETWQAILHLLQRNWFRRLWIWQEVCLARRATVVCGYETIAWGNFCCAIFCLRFKPRSRWVQDALAPSISSAYNICSYETASMLVDVLEYTKDCEFSDPKDRIYALLNLVRDEITVDLKPDYSKTATQVFQDVVLRELATHNTLDLLTHCELQGVLEEVPSWVPNFSAPNKSNLLWTSNCCRGSKTDAHYAGEGILKVAGLCSATVNSVEKVVSEDVVTSSARRVEVKRALKRLAAFYSGNGRYVDGVDMLEAFCRTFCSNEFAENFVPSLDRRPIFEESRDYLLKLVESSPESEPNYAKYLIGVQHDVAGRSFVTTREGNIGLAPLAAKAGDQVCILLGCQSPLLLRSDGHGYHTVVGECYVHGVMEGEALLGPLPSPWRRAWRLDTDQHGLFHDCFISQADGKIRIEDPRRGPLPPGWRVRDHERMHQFNSYVNDSTGEGYDIAYDPRMTAEALKACGVNITEFKLK
ncbi:hypothetical protein N7G274_007181 [Stereocaulon virgatum]|uniref:Heterokaryon incompatibility domain-containing protein n=1 Tax=Stereocaulon virgatum TaxID=373712 RepID=A0ABR4A5D1_9LECA